VKDSRRDWALFVIVALAVLVGFGALTRLGGGETASGTPPPAASSSPALSYAEPPSTERTPVSEAGTFGWEFRPTVDIEVTELGCFDAGQDGLARAHRVGIFDAQTERLLASVTVRSKSRLEGFFRWESLETPLVLKAGRVYLAGTEDKQSLETLYCYPVKWSGAPPERCAEEIEWGGFLTNRPSQGEVTAPTVRTRLWRSPPWFSPNFKFMPAAGSSPSS